MPQPAPKCPEETSIWQNEPTSDPARELSPRQLTAINALFAGHSFSDVARYMRIDRKTLFRWRKSGAFVAEIHRRYAEQQVRRNASRAPSPEPIWMTELRRMREGLIG